MGKPEYDARRRTLLQLPLLGAAPALGLLAGCTLSTGARQDFHLLRDPAGSAASSAGSTCACSVRFDSGLRSSR